MIFHFILNPKSGRSPQQKKMEQEIVDACVKRQLSYRIYYTTKPRDSIDYIRNIRRRFAFLMDIPTTEQVDRFSTYRI